MAVAAERIQLEGSHLWTHSTNTNSNTTTDTNSDIIKTYGAISSTPRDVEEKQEDDNDDKSSSSSATEIANLADVTISEDTLDGARAMIITDDVTNAIEMATLMNASSIDLSKKKIRTFPEALLKLPHLEYMYLEGNEITSLPGEFFKMFPNLRWLDVRNNLLNQIPSAYLATHSCLRNLLLEGNNLRTLPLELGLVKSLHGLNIAGNPLDFPPQEIIERGTQYILYYLKDLYEIKCSQMAELELNLSKDAADDCEHRSEVSDDWNTTASLMDLAKQREIMFQHKSHLNGNLDIHLLQDSIHDVKMENLSRPTNRNNGKKAKKTETGIIVRNKTKESKLSWKLNPYPSLPTTDYVTFKMNEEKHLAKVKEQKEKIEAIIQKQKNETVLRKWREVAKLLQQRKYSQHLLPGKDYKAPGEQAPFGIEMEMMKVLSKEDRLKADLEQAVQLKQQRLVSPRSRARQEQEKQNRILELEQQVQQHMAQMVERRRHPKGTPQQEMAVAKQELEIAEKLYNELFAQRRATEYHIKNSTGVGRTFKARKPKIT